MADQLSRLQRCAIQLIDVSPPQATSLSSDNTVSRSAAAYRRAQPARSERASSAEAEAAQAEQGPMRAEEGAVCAKELSLQLGRLLEVSNPFVHSRGSSSDGSSESAASSSPVSTARSAKSDRGGDGATRGSRIQNRRKAISAAVAGAGDDVARKKEAGRGDRSRQRRRRKGGGSGKKGKSKAELCPCGCARLIPADALGDQQREVKPRTTPCQPMNPPTNAWLFGQRSVTPTCPIESPFLDNLVRSLAFESSNDDAEAHPLVAKAGKSPGVECVASDCFRDNCGRCNASSDAASDTNESGNCRGAATELSSAVFEQKVDLVTSGADCTGANTGGKVIQRQRAVANVGSTRAEVSRTWGTHVKRTKQRFRVLTDLWDFRVGQVAEVQN
ncbi:unnamed protein product [Closterium sp. NIES-53]